MATRIPSVCLAATIVALGAAVSAQTPQAPAPAPPPLVRPEEPRAFSETDETFVIHATRNGRAEIELSKLALTRATRPDVKVFAQRMVDDHTKAGAELALLASSKGLTVPDDPAPTDRATLDQPEKLSGEEYDRKYLTQMIADHERAVDAFDEFEEKALDPALRAWAAKTLTTIREHLDLAREISLRID